MRKNLLGFTLIRTRLRQDLVTLIRTRLRQDLVTFFGFTLIELLVVVSITGILFSLGMASYNQFNRNQIFGQAVKNFKNDLRMAQSFAMTGNKDCSAGVCGGTLDGCGNDANEKTLDGWYVSFTSNTYTIYGSCQGTVFGSKTVSLDSGNLTAFNPVPTTIHFKPLTSGVDSPLTINLQLSTLNKTMTITGSGEIY